MSSDQHQISIAAAAELTLNWRRNRPPGSFDAGMFDKAAFDRLFAQDGCTGIRIYMGRHADSDPAHSNDPSKWTFVMVATDLDGNDICTKPGTMAKGMAMATETEEDGDAEQNPKVCPPICSTPDPLNTPP